MPVRDLDVEPFACPLSCVCGGSYDDRKRTIYACHYPCPTRCPDRGLVQAIARAVRLERVEDRARRHQVPCFDLRGRASKTARPRPICFWRFGFGIKQETTARLRSRQAKVSRWPDAD